MEGMAVVAMMMETTTSGVPQVRLRDEVEVVREARDTGRGEEIVAVVGDRTIESLHTEQTPFLQLNRILHHYH